MGCGVPVLFPAVVGPGHHLSIPYQHGPHGNFSLPGRLPGLFQGQIHEHKVLGRSYTRSHQSFFFSLVRSYGVS